MNMKALRNFQTRSPLIVIAAFLLLTVFATVHAEEADFAEAVGELSAKLELD